MTLKSRLNFILAIRYVSAHRISITEILRQSRTSLQVMLNSMAQFVMGPSNAARTPIITFTWAVNTNTTNSLVLILLGGRRGIRTLGTVAGTPLFESGTFNHSVILPYTVYFPI